MSIRIISFTDRGDALAGRLAEDLGGEAMRCGKLLPLEDWTARSFAEAEALIFVGAAGIAVRAVAPHVWSKTSDPAVVVIDVIGVVVSPTALKDGVSVIIGIYRHAPAVLVSGGDTCQHTVRIRPVIDENAIGTDGVFLHHSCRNHIAGHRDRVPVPGYAVRIRGRFFDPICESESPDSTTLKYKVFFFQHIIAM